MAQIAAAVGGSLLSGIVGGKGASKAEKIQAQAIQQGIDEQRNEFAQTTANEAPFLNAGTTALTGSNGLMSLLGLSGNDAQTSALSGLKDSPLYTGAYQNGVDTILQNAAATGGLRGGNTQDSLASFGGQLYSGVYQNDIANLLSLAGIGQNAGNTLAGAGQNSANSISSLLTQQGNANATAAAAPYASLASTLSGIGSTAGNATTTNSLAALLKSVTGGGGFSSSSLGANTNVLSGLGTLPF